MSSPFSHHPWRSTRRAGAYTGAVVLMFVLTVQTVPGLSAPVSIDEAQGAPGLSDERARGEYLVHSAAMCVQCHSPRDQRGNLIKGKELTGAPMPVRGPSWSTSWAYSAPALAGLPGFTDEQIIQLLTQGRAGNRPVPMAPMPPFRMTPQDAAAVVAYLRTR